MGWLTLSTSITAEQITEWDHSGSTGRQEGLQMEINADGQTLDLQPGSCIAENIAGDTFLITVGALQQISPPTTGAGDKLYEIRIKESATPGVGEVELTEVELKTASFPPNLRSGCLVGSAFYNDTVGGWTLLAHKYAEYKRPGNTAYDIGLALSPRALRHDIPLTQGSTGGKLAITKSGRILTLGGSVFDTPQSPHLHTVPVMTPSTQSVVMWRTTANSDWTTFQPTGGDAGKIQTENGDFLWTKWDDGTGGGATGASLPNQGNTDWSIMPVMIVPGRVVGGAVVSLPFVLISQVSLKNSDFKRDPVASSFAAVQNYDYPAFVLTHAAVIGVIAMQGNMTDTTDPNALFMTGVGVL